MSTEPSSILLPQEIWDNEVAAIPESAADWLFPGFISRGNLTLLTSMWKAGKTTLLAHLLARRVSGQPFLDRPVAPGKTVVISEESRGLWKGRCQQFNFGGKLCLFSQPFPHVPSADQWRRLLDRVAQLHAEHGIDLVIIDSITRFLRAENSAKGALDLLLPVRALAAQGIAALFTHHPRRHDASRGIAGRGHGALHSEMDISIEMRHAGGNLDSRARRFFCLSRHADTPRQLAFELNPDAADYTLLPDADDTAGFTEHWDVLRMVLEDAPQKLTRLDILDEWPDDFPKPAPATLWKWLQSAVATAAVHIEGTGRKSDPFRYWLPTTEARSRENPFYESLEQQCRDLKVPFTSLRQQKRRQSAVPERIGDSGDGSSNESRVWPPGAAME